MKKLTMMGLSVVVVVVLIFLFGKHAKTARDRKSSQNLAELGRGRFTAFTERAISQQMAVLQSKRYSKALTASQTAGTWHVKDGRVIVSVTNDSNKKARVLELLACRLFA